MLIAQRAALTSLWRTMVRQVCRLARESPEPIAIVATCTYGVRRSVSFATALVWLMMQTGWRVRPFVDHLSRHTWQPHYCSTREQCRDRSAGCHKPIQDMEYHCLAEAGQMWWRTCVELREVI